MFSNWAVIVHKDGKVEVRVTGDRDASHQEKSRILLMALDILTRECKKDAKS